MTAMTPLEPGFEPTNRDIVCARGRTAYNHKGNQHFRGFLERNLEKYQSAKTKQQKTTVVNALLEEIKDHSRFVRKLPDGKWIEVPEHVAKEKIGQGFRDLLHTQYRSSTKSKVKLRRERRKRQKRQQQEQQESSAGHRPTNSLETFEPLPLDDSTASTEELIYDCTAFAFATKEEDPDKPGDGEDENLHSKPTVSEGPIKVEGDKEGDAAAPRQETTAEVSSNEVPNFVSPASAPSPSRQAQTHSEHDGGPPPSTTRPTPRHDHFPSWHQHQEGYRSHHPPPPGPPPSLGSHYSPPGHEYYPPRQHYSPPYSPPEGYHHLHAPPPPPQYPAPHHHHHHQNAASPTPGGWPPHHHASYGNYHSGYHYASPHPSLYYGPRRGYSYQPSPEDYYSPPPQTREEYGGRDGYHDRYYQYPPGRRAPEHNRRDEGVPSIVAGNDQIHHLATQDPRAADHWRREHSRRMDEAALPSGEQRFDLGSQDRRPAPHGIKEEVDSRAHGHDPVVPDQGSLQASV